MFLIPILFFLSGFTALIYQMVWMRELILVFGASMFAISTLLTAFMGGLALGSWFFGKRADRYSNPLFVYALLELGIGGYAFLVPLFFSYLIPVYQSLSNLFDFSFYAFSLVRFVLAIVILLIPTALMGGTLPVLAQLYKTRETVGKGVGLLYAFNTFGAVMGVLGAGFVLLPALGLQKTVFLAAGMNGLISALAYFKGRGKTVEQPSLSLGGDAAKVSREPLVSKGERRQRHILLTVFAVSGFSAMIYEVVWTRILTLILGSTVYSYATMLATFLLGLAIGSFIFSILLKRFSKPLLLLATIQGGIAFFCFAGEFIFPLLPTAFFNFMGIFHTWSRVRAASKFLLSGAVMLIPTILMGGVFPLVIHILTSKGESEKKALGSIVGRAYAINTLGTIVGSFSVGFIFLPLLGIQKSLHLAVLTNTLLCMTLWSLLRGEGGAATSSLLRRRRWGFGIITAFFFIVIFTTPTWNPLMMSSDLFGKAAALDLLYYEEGISSTVTVVQHPTLAKRPHLTLAIDGKPNASTTGDMKTQLMVGHLPMLLAPQLRDVMLIGHGSGITTGAMAKHPFSRLVTLELEPAVIEASRYFDSFSGNILDDPRVTLVMDDARNYLLRNDDRFDVIVSEPSHPWRSGSAKLFTREFFEIGRAHLSEGGIFTQWIHFYGIRAPELKSVIKTFHSVFPQVLIFYTDSGDLILLGSVTPFRINRKQMSKRFSTNAVVMDLARVGIYSIFDLWSHFLLGPDEIETYVGDAELNTDDFTLVEFQTPKSLFEDTMSIHIAEMKAAASKGRNYLIRKEEPPAEQATAYYALSKGYLRYEKEDEAVEMITQGLLLNTTAEGEWLRGAVLQKVKDLQGAEEAWMRALDKDKTHGATLLSLAKFYQKQGAYKKAAPLLDLLWTAHPEIIRGYYYHGVNLYYQGRYEEALETLHRSRFFSEPFAYYYKSLTLGKLGREREAKRALGEFIVSLDETRKELETQPKKYEKLAYRETVAWRREVGILIPEEERMAQIFEKIVGTPLGHLYGGAGLFMLGFFDEAAEALEEGIKKMGRVAPGSVTYYYLGLTYKELGRFGEAEEAFDVFIKNHIFDPEDLRVVEAKKMLDRLKYVSGRDA